MARAAALALLNRLGIDAQAPTLLGRRGYYRNTMGVPGENDRGIYDDAMLLVSPTAFVTFNANTDPTRAGGHLAVLVPGVYTYKLGIHGLSRPADQRYEALVQAGPVTVQRDDGKRETGWFGINIHRGGYTTTSSEGCQTIWPEQWDAFRELVKSEMRRFNMSTITYALTEFSA